MKKILWIVLTCLLGWVLPAFPAALPGYTDVQGNPIPDYSYSGYCASSEAIPYVEVKAYVPPMTGDATAYIQAAIDYVSALPLGEDGFRGAVQLAPGRYEIAGSLRIAASGVVLRGSGSALDEGAEATELLGTGYDRQALIRVAGKADAKLGPKRTCSQSVAVGDMSVVLDDVSGLAAGQTIVLSRWASQSWIDSMDMNDFGGATSYLGWKVGDDTRPSDVEVRWQRDIVSVDGQHLRLDAPITCAINREDAFVQTQQWPGRISHSAVENLRLRSTYDESQPKDENHRWMAIILDHGQDLWVRNVTCRHFAGSAVFITENVRRVTVADCRSYEPVSEIGGTRRCTFHTLGGQCLFLRLYAEQGLHDFSTGRVAPGPNAFVDCKAVASYHLSGAADAWTTGLLFDGFEGQDVVLAYGNRGQDAMGAGWTAGNSMMWRCRAAVLAHPNPPTAHNWTESECAQCQAEPSLFFAQLAARSGKATAEVRDMLKTQTEWPAAAGRPDLDRWTAGYRPETQQSQPALMQLQQGLLVRDGAVMSGSSQGIIWWNGSLKSRYLATNSRPHVTRWVPGRVGEGFTDDIDELTDQMVAKNKVALVHHYGLWYDRRRDDHERIRRMDGYVWAPFYEQPFARSGQGQAYDGLSKYDLTRWNTWYWLRLKKYADLADQKGLVLFHQYFFQHNILEAGAHWADCPWRSANNINDMGFPEPVPYAIDKRVYMAEQFYDVSYAPRRELYRNYIRKALDEFADNGSVIFFLSEEYTGPLHFVQFWLETIGEWEKETGHDAKVALSCTKDVQDAILADEKYAALVDVIDIRFWRPTMKGFYAPRGGLSLAPRQFDRLRNEKLEVLDENAKARNMEERIYEVILDYRQRFPDKAVLLSTGGDAWSAFMAGASLCSLPKNLPLAFKQAATQMQAIDNEACMQRGKAGVGYVFYAPHGDKINVDLKGDKRTYRACWINPRSGEVMGETFKLKASMPVSLDSKGLLWLYR